MRIMNNGNQVLSMEEYAPQGLDWQSKLILLLGLLGSLALASLMAYIGIHIAIFILQKLAEY